MTKLLIYSYQISKLHKFTPKRVSIRTQEKSVKKMFILIMQIEQLQLISIRKGRLLIKTQGNFIRISFLWHRIQLDLKEQ